jgi:hypothetical protein
MLRPTDRKFVCISPCIAIDALQRGSSFLSHRTRAFPEMRLKLRAGRRDGGREVRPQANFFVHSLAVLWNVAGCCLSCVAIAGTSGWSGFGSVSSDEMDSSSFEMPSAGVHASRRMSRQMPPFSLMLGCYTFVLNFTRGALIG